ncbi:RecF/RecN/SMC protein [Epithele typhae]|uniref:RecF/RecN/SMC protein n=1 Tax=Epithele typhae TaxID=378194 RepID=UPI0020079523|nr:RecF/RecN/SMC protein [Epithele typhae]KAH9932103.1 RecF/RecN/SMC protein [Epithele typhae]
MPPRRSSRSRASVEPVAAAPKRKRNEPAVVESDEEDAKPIARTRRSSSTQPAAKTRTSTRSRKSLEEVQEDEEDEEESQPPARKKSRPSLETEDEEADPKEVPNTRTRETGSPWKEVNLDYRIDDSENEAPYELNEDGEIRQLPPPKRASSTRVKKEKEVYVIDDSEDEVPSKSKAKPKVKRAMTPVKEEVAQEDEEELEDVKPEPANEDGEDDQDAPAAAPTKADEDEEEEETEAVSAAVLPKREPATPPPVEEEFEEEHSFLDPPLPTSPQKQSQVAPVQEEPQGPTPRLVIHKLVLVNFKSYAGRQEIGPFHKSFSAIVGPNGSGKSNTIDALLFVFGYRASKMRQGKLSELIHNSANYPDLMECSVEVHFKEILDLPGPDAFEVVPDSLLTVTRTAYKNNSSRYSINGRGSNYGEVQTLLKGRGIDLDHNRFLILQGEVESIAQMKPKGVNENDDGLLEYLEDIIGTAQYKQPIEAGLVEVERLSEERQQKLTRLRIVDKDRKSLESKKKEAEDYLRMLNDLTRHKSKLWQYYVWQCWRTTRTCSASWYVLLPASSWFHELILSFSTLERAQPEALKGAGGQPDKIDASEEAMAELEANEALYKEVKEAADACEHDFKRQEKLHISLEEKCKHGKNKTKKLKKSIEEDERARNEAKRNIEDSTAKIHKVNGELKELQQKLVQEEAALEKIVDSLKDQLQEGEIDVWTSERNALEMKAETASEPKLRRGLARELRGELQKKTAETLRGKVQDLRQKADASRRKASEARASQEQSRSNNVVLDGLTRLKTQGRLSGFHGRLGALGTIPDKYDIAISTAAGGALNNFVVDTVEQGQECIQYLRQQSLGRANFTVLEKLTNDRGMEPIQTPENVPRLFDLIKPKDKRYAPAFYKAVHNTLVANDLEQANRIAFGGARRCRVVTLNGQLIEASGAMSGGGGRPQRGAMSSKFAADIVSPDVLRQYQQDSDQDQRALDTAVGRCGELELKLDSLRKDHPKLEDEFQFLNMGIAQIKKRIEEAEKTFKQLQAQSKPESGDLSRIAALDKKIVSATAEQDKLQGKVDAIQKEIQALEKKILEIGGTAMLAKKSAVEGCRNYIKIANGDLTKNEVLKSQAEKDIKKYEANLETNRAMLEGEEESLQELTQQCADVSELMSELTKKLEEAKVAAEDVADKVAAQKAEVKEMEESIMAFRKREMGLQQDIAEVTKKADDNRETMDHWNQKHETLSLEDVDDESDDDDDDEADPNAEGGEDAESGKKVKKEPDTRKPDGDEDPHKLKEFPDAVFLDEQIKRANPDLSVLKDYRKREKEFLDRANDLEAITKLRDESKAEYDALTKKRLDEFMAGFSAISLKLKEMYQMITLGGNAELELVDSMDPFSEGIIFSVMPPKKSWKNISNLSGGEKPTPLYFMDEIDAALDFRNVSIVANYVKDRTKNAQFIIISLRNDMFELSHRLIGIYKTANATRSIAIDNHALATIPLNSLSVAS